MNILLSDEFKTKLGTIKTWLESDLSNSVVVSKDNYLVTNSHKITMQKLTSLSDWSKQELNLNLNCESSMGWRWFLEKINDEDEKLTLFCELINPKYDIETDCASGEWLEAIVLENKTHHLHIGTEDGEVMHYRSKYNDFMPPRFEKILGYSGTHYSFTEYTDFGFKTTIPQLFKDEKIYFHFVVATNPNKINEDNTRDWNISTDLAVEWHKDTLDKYTDSNDFVES